MYDLSFPPDLNQTCCEGSGQLISRERIRAKISTQLPALVKKIRRPGPCLSFLWTPHQKWCGIYQTAVSKETRCCSASSCDASLFDRAFHLQPSLRLHRIIALIDSSEKLSEHCRGGFSLVGEDNCTLESCFAPDATSTSSAYQPRYLSVHFKSQKSKPQK